LLQLEPVIQERMADFVLDVEETVAVGCRLIIIAQSAPDAFFQTDAERGALKTILLERVKPHIYSTALRTERSYGSLFEVDIAQHHLATGTFGEVRVVPRTAPWSAHFEDLRAQVTPGSDIALGVNLCVNNAVRWSIGEVLPKGWGVFGADAHRLDPAEHSASIETRLSIIELTTRTVPDYGQSPWTNHPAVEPAAEEPAGAAAV
jgi:hypothetical protein